MKKILIKAPNWLGDSVMSIPTVVRIKELYPFCEVYIWTKSSLMDLWRFIPEVDNVVDSVKGKKFDLGILLTNSFSSALKMYLAKIPERRGYSINWRRLLLTQPVSLNNGYKDMHQIEYFVNIMDTVNIHSIHNKDCTIPKINIPEELREEARQFLINNGWDGESKIIGIHANASYGPAKCWIKERFIELIDRLDTTVLIIGTKEEREDFNNNGKIINIAGQTDIRMLSGVLNLCCAFVANDSGPMHLAAAIGIPVVAIFGSTDPKKTGPRGNCSILKKDILCNPCFKRTCPGELECMKEISVKDVINAIDRLMSKDAFRTPRPLQIAIVMKDYDESKGGAERYLIGLAPRLAKEFGAIDLIVNKIKGNVPSGVNVKTVNAIRWSSILEPLSFNRAVQGLLKKENYDVVYGLTQIYPQDVYRVGGGLEHSWFEIRYPKLWQRLINYVRPRNIVRLYIENRIFRTCKRFITNSQLVKNQILHHYKISPENIKVVYNGVSVNRFNPRVRGLYRDKVRQELGIGKEDKVVLFISNNWKRKGLRELINAKKKDTWLIVAGRGKAVRLRSRQAQREARIKFVGSTKDPEKYYGASDVFVLPTYYDPCANVCIEALCCGLPVVTTRMNGAAEFIEDGKNGYIIDDFSELAVCIEKAFSLQGKGKIPTVDQNANETVELLRNIQGIGKGTLELKDWIDKEGSGVVYKKNKLRSVVKIENVFLKRYFNSQAAFKEWQNIFRLRSIGIKTMDPIKVGEVGKDSYMVTESLEPAERLEDFIRSIGSQRLPRQLIRRLAELTKKMHENNLFHKDFYSGHIFLKRDEPYLIDLQRVERHWLFKAHWRIKDLASLNFSVCTSNTDRLRFLKYYMGKMDKEFIRKILSKTNRIARHTKKILAKRKTICRT